MNQTPEILPDRLPVVPLVEAVPLPGPSHQVNLSPEFSRWLRAPEALRALQQLALVPVDEAGELPPASAWPMIGASASVRRVLRLPDGASARCCSRCTGFGCSIHGSVRRSSRRR